MNWHYLAFLAGCALTGIGLALDLWPVFAAGLLITSATVDRGLA